MSLPDDGPDYFRKKLISNVKLAVSASGIYAHGANSSDRPDFRLRHLECVKAGMEILDDLGDNDFRYGQNAKSKTEETQ